MTLELAFIGGLVCGVVIGLIFVLTILWPPIRWVERRNARITSFDATISEAGKEEE